MQSSHGEVGPDPDIILYFSATGPCTSLCLLLPAVRQRLTLPHHAAVLFDVVVNVVVVVDDAVFVFLLADRDANVLITSNVL